MTFMRSPDIHPTASGWITLTIQFAVVTLAVLALPSPGHSQVRSFPAVDEASRDREFLEFRTRLQSIVATHDAAGLRALVAPDVRWSFGDRGGIDGALADWQLDSSQSRFWPDLDAVLRLGGKFRGSDTFEAPYVSAAFPGDLDAFAYTAIVADGVNVRAEPDANSAKLTTLNRSLVEVNSPSSSSKTSAGWTPVRLVDGRSGFVASRYVRSPIEHRATFERRGGRWLLTAFVAGD
jgi:hypothetical protein